MFFTLLLIVLLFCFMGVSAITYGGISLAIIIPIILCTWYIRKGLE